MAYDIVVASTVQGVRIFFLLLPSIYAGKRDENLLIVMSDVFLSKTSPSNVLLIGWSRFYWCSVNGPHGSWMMYLRVAYSLVPSPASHYLRLVVVLMLTAHDGCWPSSSKARCCPQDRVLRLQYINMAQSGQEGLTSWPKTWDFSRPPSAGTRRGPSPMFVFLKTICALFSTIHQL